MKVLFFWSVVFVLGGFVTTIIVVRRRRYRQQGQPSISPSWLNEHVYQDGHDGDEP